jgi:hypothetical protein
MAGDRPRPPMAGFYRHRRDCGKSNSVRPDVARAPGTGG